MKGAQIIVGLIIVIGGGGALAGEYFLVKWWPTYKQQVADETLKLLPYRNDGLGIEMQVSAGIYGKVESFPSGVKVYRHRWVGTGPSITITSQPNPDQAFEFSPQIMAIWETDGVQHNIPRYHFEQTKIMNRDAALIWQWKNRSMILTAHVISPDRIIEADCVVGDEDEALFMQACDASLRTVKLAGPMPPEKFEPGVQELPGTTIH